MSYQLDKTDLTADSDSSINLITKRILYQGICFLAYLFIGILLTFILTRMMPDNPYKMLLANGGVTSDAQRQVYLENVERLGLDQPVIVQFFKYIGVLVSGDWGTSISISSGTPVGELIIRNFPRSIEICGVTLLITLILAIPLGRLAAKKETQTSDRGILCFSKIYFGVPLVFVALLFQFLLALESQIFPFYSNYMSTTYEITYISEMITGFPLLDSLLNLNLPMFGDVLLHLLLPCLTMSFLFGSLLIPVVRANRLKKNKNIAEPYIDQTSLYAFNFSVIFMALISVESIFNLSGISSLLIMAINAVDYYVVNAIVFLLLLSFLLPNFILNVIHIIRDKDNGELAAFHRKDEGPNFQKSPQVENDDGASFSSDDIKSYFKVPSIIVGLSLFAVLILLAILAPIFFNKVDISGVSMGGDYMPPSSEHLLGTTRFGRDVLGGLMFGIGSLISYSLGVALVGAIIGIPIGFISGAKGGKIGTFFMVCGNVIMLLPQAVLFIVLSSVMGTSNILGFITFSLLSAIFLGQLTRNLVLKHINRSGRTKELNLLFKEMLPQLISLILFYSTFIAIMKSTVSYYGYSDPSSIDLGNWVALARNNMQFAFHAVFWPAFGIFLVCLSFMLISHGFSLSSNFKSSNDEENKGSPDLALSNHTE
ncbi:ABC transporter permease subunit [Candidatus Lokiarchaeum ossiferum]|uniref:ABC transporter permease subunit n=1 Tax=Candidatus Lokiarchaeum ossiferum TaxID=2951803 RepID=UPI00352EA212